MVSLMSAQRRQSAGNSFLWWWPTLNAKTGSWLDNGVKDHRGTGLQHRMGLPDRVLDAELDLVAVVD